MSHSLHPFYDYFFGKEKINSFFLHDTTLYLRYLILRIKISAMRKSALFRNLISILLFTFILSHISRRGTNGKYTRPGQAQDRPRHTWTTNIIATMYVCVCLCSASQASKLAICMWSELLGGSGGDFHKFLHTREIMKRAAETTTEEETNFHQQQQQLSNAFNQSQIYLGPLSPPPPRVWTSKEQKRSHYIFFVRL